MKGEAITTEPIIFTPMFEDQVERDFFDNVERPELEKEAVELRESYEAQSD